MERNELNRLADTYRKNRCERSYEEAYRLSAGVRRTHMSALIKTRYGDEQDAEEIFDTVFDRLMNKEVTTDFARFLSASLRNARIDFIRKEKRRRDKLHYLEDKVKSKNVDISDAPTLESTLRSESNTETEALEKKKRAESRTLIDSLLESTTDSVTTAIVTRFHRHDSANSLAKAVGVHHSAVSRKLTALSRHYDVNRFGDIRDYLAV